MTNDEERHGQEDNSGGSKVKKAKARRHKASWKDAVILSLLFAGVLFAIYMIEKYQ
jgi:hypothetical protein